MLTAWAIFMFICSLLWVGWVVRLAITRFMISEPRGKVKSANEITKTEPKKPKVKLSFPAAQIIQAFNALPKAHRPAYNIDELVQALDIKHDRVSMDYHFSDFSYGYTSGSRWDVFGGTHQSSNCRRIQSNGGSCPGQEYIDLYLALIDISVAVKKQEHALKMSEVAHELESVSELTAALRLEKEIINDVTKELTS